MNKIKKFAVILTFFTACISTYTQAVADKLEDILNTGELRVGVLLDAAPWGFKDSEGNDTGLDIELAKLMAKDLNADLKIVSLTGQSRIPSLLANKVDLLIAAAGATPERAQQVMFSQPYAAVSLGIYGSDETDLTTNISDLNGKNVAVAKGSTLDTWLTDNAPEIKVSRFEDTPSAITAFLSGQVDYFAENSAISIKVKQDNPDKSVQLVYLIRQSPAHIAVAKNEQNLLNWINTFLFYHRLNGGLADLQQQFFNETQDLPNM